MFAFLFGNAIPIFGATLPASHAPQTTYSLTLQWAASPSPEVVGYHLYYGTVSGIYTNSIVLGNVTTATVSGLVNGVTYYFAMTGYDTNGQESDFSQEISYEQDLPGAVIQSQGLSGGQFTLTVSGPAGHTYAIEATQDFANWTVIGTLTLDGSGSQDFTDTNTADFPQRFYRAQAQP